MRRALPFFCLLLIPGCGEGDPIKRYRVAKDPKWRMIAAMIPHQGSVWFFKVAGPDLPVGKHQEEVVSFLKQVKFSEKGPTWTLPEGWKEGESKSTRFATLLFGPERPPLELSVVTLQGDGGGTAANVNRWRGQIGLVPLPRTEAEKAVTELEIDGARGVMVDLVGPLRPMGGPMAGGRMASSPPPQRAQPAEGDQLNAVRALFTYRVPEGWEENRAPKGRRIYEFTVKNDGESALVTFTIFPGDMGGLAANINRWRTQAGLGDVDERAATDLARPFTFLGRQARSATLVGAGRAILSVFHLDSQFSMFLKMDGPPSVVVGQRETFLKFAQSMSMGAHDE